MKNSAMRRIEELFELYEADINLCLKVYEVIKEAMEEERPGLYRKVSFLLKRSDIGEKESLYGIDEDEVKDISNQLGDKNSCFLEYVKEMYKNGIISSKEQDELVWNHIESLDTLYEKAFAMYDIGIDMRYPSIINIGDYTKYLLSTDEYNTLFKKCDIEKEVKLKYILFSKEFIQYSQVAHALTSLLDECKSEEEKIVLMIEIIKFYRQQ